MHFPPREILLKDGRTAVLRPTAPDDAADMIEYMKRTAAETPYLLRCPDEVRFTPEQERELLGKILGDPASAMMVALVDGRVAGNASLSGLGDKRRIRHRCSVAIALYEEFWGLGIGSAMFAYLGELAEQIGYEQMELEVMEDNARARAFYVRCGFAESGRVFRSFKFDDGRYLDGILMYKLLREDRV